MTKVVRRRAIMATNWYGFRFHDATGKRHCGITTDPQQHQSELQERSAGGRVYLAIGPMTEAEARAWEALQTETITPPAAIDGLLVKEHLASRMKKNSRLPTRRMEYVVMPALDCTSSIDQPESCWATNKVSAAASYRPSRCPHPSGLRVSASMRSKTWLCSRRSQCRCRCRRRAMADRTRCSPTTSASRRRLS